MKATKTKTKEKPTWLISRHQIIDKIISITTPIWDSKSKKLKPKMTIAQACSEVWITVPTYRNWLNADPVLANMVEEVYASHRQMMDDISTSIVMEGLNGDVKLRPNEKIQLAKWYLEKSSPYFNPSQRIELESTAVSYDMSEEEIINRIKELSQEVWETIALPKITPQENVNYTSSDSNEESTWDAENSNENIKD